MAGKAGPAGKRGWKFEPPALTPKRIPSPTRAATVTSRKTVRTFWTTAPDRMPNELRKVRKRIEAAATTWPAEMADGQPQGLGPEQDVACREDRDERAQEFGEGDGQGGQSAAHDEPEKGPPEKEGRGRTVGLAEVDVLAAGLRVHRPELRERERPAERDEAPGQPDDEKETGGGEPGGDEPRGHEDPRADDGPDDQERRIDETELPEEPRFRRDGRAGGIHFGPHST